MKGNRLEQALRTKLKAEDRARLHEFGRLQPEIDGESPAEQAEPVTVPSEDQSMNQDR